MTYFYEFELILAGIILLTAMALVGSRLWWKRKIESQKADFTGSNISNHNTSDEPSYNIG